MKAVNLILSIVLWLGCAHHQANELLQESSEALFHGAPLINMGNLKQLLPTREEINFVEERLKQRNPPADSFVFIQSAKLSEKNQEIFLNIDPLGVNPSKTRVAEYAARLKELIPASAPHSIVNYQNSPIAYLLMKRFKNLKEVRAAIKGARVLRYLANIYMDEVETLEDTKTNRKKKEEAVVKLFSSFSRAARLGDEKAFSFFGRVIAGGKFGIPPQPERAQLYLCTFDPQRFARSFLLRELEETDPKAYALEPDPDNYSIQRDIREEHYMRDKELQTTALLELTAPTKPVNDMTGKGKDDYDLPDKENDDEGLEVKEAEETPLLRKADGVRPAEIYLVENGIDKGATPSRSTSVVRHRGRR